MLNSVLTTRQINYIQNIKPRYNAEPEFRKVEHRNTTNYINRIKDTEEYKEKRREISRQCCHNCACMCYDEQAGAIDAREGRSQKQLSGCAGESDRYTYYPS